MSPEGFPERQTASKSMMASDFVRGVLHHVALRSGNVFQFNVNDTKLHKAFKAAYDALDKKAEAEDFDVEFHIIPHHFHGDSETITAELYGMYGSREMESLSGSYVNLRYHSDYPTAVLMAEYLPGTPELYEELATAFMESYEDRKAA